MTVAGTKRHVIDLSQIGYLPNGFLGERRLAFKRVKDNALEQISKRQIF